MTEEQREEGPSPYVDHHYERERLYPNITQMPVIQGKGEWKEMEGDMLIEGKLVGRIKIVREGEECRESSIRDESSVTGNPRVSLSAKRELELRKLKEGSNVYLREIGVPTSTPSLQQQEK